MGHSQLLNSCRQDSHLTAAALCRQTLQLLDALVQLRLAQCQLGRLPQPFRLAILLNEN